MISWQRLAYILGMAVVETTPLAVVLLFTGGSGIWLLLLGIVLAGALADWIVQRWLPVERQRPALLVTAFLVALWAIKGQVGGDYGLLSSWDLALGALFSLRGEHSGLAYLLLLATIYTFWRGTRLLGHDKASLRTFFTRATIALMLIIGFGFWIGGTDAEPFVPAATAMVLIFFAVGLLTIALAGSSEVSDTQLSRLGWRGFLTISGAIGLVLLFGLLFVSLFGKGVLQVVYTIWTIFATAIVLIMLPLFFVVEALVRWLFTLFDFRVVLEALERLQQRQLIQQQQATKPLQALPPWVSVLLQVVLALVPVLILVALFLLSRRRGRRMINGDEVRESLWSWNGLTSDLRSLIAGLRLPQRGGGGLRAALARLRGTDPVSRIRRSYLRLLLLGEAREHPRTPPQTPREYSPTASAVLPTARQPIGTLTSAYERARYHPDSVATTDADAAERAWNEIDAADRRG